MAAFVLELVIDGEQQVLSALSRFGEYANDLHVPFGEMATDFARAEGARFAAQGPGWAALSPEYAAWKAAHYPGKPILQRTGALLGSLTGGAGFIREITDEAMTLGTRVGYARFHQRGTGRMPKREVIRLQPEDRLRWAKIMQKHLVAEARRAGLMAEATG